MKLLILDGNSLANRAFYGVRLLTSSDGTHTNAVFGFISILQKLLDEERPDGLCVMFDRPEKTFRHIEFDAYKANRKGMPEELAEQFPILRNVLCAMNIPYFELPGFEADDLIGTVCKLGSKQGDTCVIVTGDRDSLQLIDKNVRVKLATTKTGQTLEFDEEKFLEEYGFAPPMLVDLKGLMGDSSDNIPGVPGVGEKTALDLCRRFGGIDEIYKDIDALDVKDSVKNKLKAGKESAFLSRKLATIDKNAPINIDFASLTLVPPDNAKLYQLFNELGFKKFIERMNLSAAASAKDIPEIEKSPVPQRIYSGDELLSMLKFFHGKLVSVICPDDLNAAALCADGKVFTVLGADIGEREYANFLQILFSDEIRKCVHGLKPLMTLLLDEGFSFGGFEFDTALGAYVLDPSLGDYSLKTLGAEYIPVQYTEENFNLPDAFSPLGNTDDSLNSLAVRACAISRLHENQHQLIGQQGMHRLYYEIELPLCEVLARMEHSGFMIDRARLSQFREMLTDRIEKRQSKIFELAGEQFNINSTKILGEILFTKLGLPHDKKTKTGYSTNIEVLEKLRGKHQIIEEIIEYRMLTKLKSTYADGLLRVIAPDGKIHSNFQMTVTTTGRLSSTEPNLQNIPVRTELGGMIREMFVPSKPGWLLIDADYSQIELRILAHISNDETMISAFSSGEDIHKVTASQVFGVPLSEVTGAMRKSAKAVNFGIVYGISEFSLAEDIGVSRFEARQYIDGYLEKYSGVRQYMSEIVVRAKADGFVTTLFSRRRYLPELKSSNHNIRSFGERVALNTPIQGTAADIMKLAMINVAKTLAAEGLEAQLLLQVHDELVVEAPENEAERVSEILRREMEAAADLRVALIAEAGIGKNWASAKK